MQVFHGSYTEILKINLSKSQANKDFGKDFYVTKFRPQAEKWAAIIARINHKKPVVTEFTFYERAFEDERYKVLRFNDYNEEWLDFVILNRDRTYNKDLITEFDFEEENATDIFYSSKTFSKLSDKNTEFYLKSWQEIYEILKKELKL